MKNLEIDIETYSSIDLNKCGVYKYAEADDFEILLFGYSIDGGDVMVVDLAAGECIPQEVLNALTDDAVTKWAFNAAFERVCLSVFNPTWCQPDLFHDTHLYPKCARYLKPESWKCSMIWSAYLVCFTLNGVGSVLGWKNKSCPKAKTSSVISVYPASLQRQTWSHRNLYSHDTEKWERFKAYNKRDVETEMQIQIKLSRFPVPDTIWEEYHIDQEINDRGIALDMTLVEQAIAMDERSKKALTDKMKQLTELDNPNSVVQMKQWLLENGLK
jgi:DNA polymerase